MKKLINFLNGNDRAERLVRRAIWTYEIAQLVKQLGFDSSPVEIQDAMKMAGLDSIEITSIGDSILIAGVAVIGPEDKQIIKTTYFDWPKRLFVGDTLNITYRVEIMP